METLQYEIEISAPVEKVWSTMLDSETYRQWVEKSWPNSFYEGKWEKGERIRFIGPDGSGTLAEITELKHHKMLLARHIAILGPGGEEDRTSDMAKTWVGITEAYHFSEKNGTTRLTVIIETKPEWRKMFDDGWPGALEELKRISEGQLTEAK